MRVYFPLGPIKRQSNQNKSYLHFGTNGEVYALDYNGTSGVLKITSNITKDKDVLMYLGRHLDSMIIDSLELIVEPNGEVIGLGWIRRMEYIDHIFNS